MTTKILPCLLLMMVMVACKKDKFQTAPTLTLKSTSEKVVRSGGSLRVSFELTDKEGDISDTLFFKKVRINPTSLPLIRDSLTFAIPQVVNTRSVLIDLNLDYNFHLITTAGSQPDSLKLQVWVHDKADNKSNVVEIENVVVLKS